MPRLLPIGEYVRRRAEVIARTKAREDAKREKKKRAKWKENWKKWDRRVKLRKYHERTAHLKPLREELKKLKAAQPKKVISRGLPYWRHRELTPEIAELCIRAICIEFDTLPALVDIRLRDAPDKRTKEIIYMMWWLLRSKFRISALDIAGCYQSTPVTVRKYTQDAQHILTAQPDHPLSLLMKRLRWTLEMLRSDRTKKYRNSKEPVPRELIRTAQCKGGQRPKLPVMTARLGRKRYKFALLIAE